jgi:hypothetical protein
MGEAEQRPRARPRKPTPEFTWEDAATASLPVLACFLGGATEKWAEGVVVAVLGVLLLLNPPRFSLGIVVNAVVVALLACAAMAYLPASWFWQPEWRQALVDDLGIKVASTVSPQPWMTTTALLSFIAGVSWFYYVAGGDIEVRAARRQLRIFALGVITLAGVAIVLHLARTALPFWQNERNFGPFPNRNQTANVIGITSIIITACAHEEIRRGRKGWMFWLVGMGVVIAAIVLNFSRAGILILLVGNGLWLAVLMFRKRSVAGMAIGGAVVLALLTVLLVFGGQTLERFNLRGGGGTAMLTDYRWLIFRDAWELIRASPWPGIGLGNFQPVFAIFRDASIGQSQALHPESDWLWLCAEVGWPAVLLVILGAGFVIRQVFPLGEGTNQWFRIAALIAALLFALHGLVDVAGHRVGSAYAGVFLLGLALRRPMPRIASGWLTNGFRVIGVLLFFVGIAWLVAAYRGISLPGSIGVDRERELAASANVGRLHNDTIRHTSKALEWAPLDWQLYFLRALGRLGAQQAPGEALADFRRARFLEPNSFEVPYQEGVAWITSNPTLAMTAWREALKRAAPERAALYDRMLSSASHLNPVVHRMLQEFGGTQPDLALTLLERAQGEAFATAMNRLLKADPALRSLNDEQKRKLFALWTERGATEQLVSFVEQHPESLAEAWRGVAKHRAARRDFAGAVELARQFSARPTLPQAASGSSIDELQRSLFANPASYGTAFTLYHQQMEAGKTDDALMTLRRLAEQPGSPAYFHYLEAEAWGAKGDAERSWNAWQAYERAIAK